INKRFGAYSKTFKIPGSPRNKELLGMLHSHSSQPRVFDPRNRTKAILLSDRLPVLRGHMSLKNVTVEGSETFFEIELTDNTVGFMPAIKGLRLTDLDLSDYGHIFNKNNIVASWQDPSVWPWEKGFFYPCYLKLTSPYDVRDFTPAWFTRAL